MIIIMIDWNSFRSGTPWKDTGSGNPDVKILLNKADPTLFRCRGEGPILG